MNGKTLLQFADLGKQIACFIRLFAGANYDHNDLNCNSVCSPRCFVHLLRKRAVSKTKHSKTKTEARSTQISPKTKHPKIENEAPKSRKRSTQIIIIIIIIISKAEHPKIENEAPKTRKQST